MCLQTVDHPTKYTDLTEGYKLVKKIGNRLIPEYYGNGTLKENIWIYNKKYKYPSVPNKILSRYGTDKYYLGFHVFVLESHARKIAGTHKHDYHHTIIAVKVKIGNIISSGIQVYTGVGTVPVIITKRIKIVERL